MWAEAMAQTCLPVHGGTTELLGRCLFDLHGCNGCWSTSTSIWLCKMNPLKHWCVRLLIFKAFNESFHPPTWNWPLMFAIVSFNVERALGRIKSLSWNCRLGLPRIWSMCARKWQNATKEAFILQKKTFNALPFISALGDVDAKCSLCWKTVAHCNSFLIRSPSFTYLKTRSRALLTCFRHLDPFTWAGCNISIPSWLPRVLKSCLLFLLKWYVFQTKCMML